MVNGASANPSDPLPPMSSMRSGQRKNVPDWLNRPIWSAPSPPARHHASSPPRLPPPPLAPFQPPRHPLPHPPEAALAAVPTTAATARRRRCQLVAATPRPEVHGRMRVAWQEGGGSGRAT